MAGSCFLLRITNTSFKGHRTVFFFNGLRYNSYIIQVTYLKCIIQLHLVYSQLCNYHYNLSLEHFLTSPPKKNPYLLTITSHHSFPLISPRQSLIHFLPLLTYLFWTFHIREIIYYEVFGNGPLSLSICFQDLSMW